jgi:hypothetical protein
VIVAFAGSFIGSVAIAAILAILGLTGSRLSPIQSRLACTLVAVATAAWDAIGPGEHPNVEPDVPYARNSRDARSSSRPEQA